MTRRTAVSLLLSAAAGAAQERSLPQRREFIAPFMGTLWRLVFFLDDTPRAQAAREAAWKLLAEVDAALSDYKEDSEVSRLSRDGRVVAGDHFSSVLETAQRISERTDGAFDVTVGRVVRLWRTARKNKALPAAEDLAAAVKTVDWRAVKRSGEGGAEVRLAPAGALVDLGGIAKGYAQDAVLALLRREFGIGAALIDAGGGVSVSAAPADGPAWRIGLAPAVPEGEGGQLALVERSVATSGDAKQFVEIGGVRYSHIVDPRTGLGLTTRVQASVIATSGATADALATAFCVMGEEKARAFLAEEPAVLARLTTVRPDGTPRVWSSRGFSRFEAA